MFKNKNNDKNNICGERVAELRMAIEPKCSQRQLAELLQLQGVDLDKNAIQRIECGKRFITDIEIQAFCRVFKISYNEFFGENNT
ncbi:MAG: helix-turn-helix transcriptional regulator [Clostridia bacterium]|nr:helix-turn-helix transcriptional regulator [Clostridia bacterium]